MLKPASKAASMFLLLRSFLDANEGVVVSRSDFERFAFSRYTGFNRKPSRLSDEDYVRSQCRKAWSVNAYGISRIGRECHKTTDRLLLITVDRQWLCWHKSSRSKLLRNAAHAMGSGVKVKSETERKIRRRSIKNISMYAFPPGVYWFSSVNELKVSRDCIIRSQTFVDAAKIRVLR